MKLLISAIYRKDPFEISQCFSATLDLLRWISCFLVVAGHARAFLFLPYSELTGLPTKLFYLLTGFGHQAVIVFFVLSGFLVGGSALEKIENRSFKLKDYIINRVSLLYPVLLACLLLTGALDWIGFTYYHQSGIYSASEAHSIGVINYNARNRWGIMQFFNNLLMLQGLIGSTFGSNGPLWSLSMEFWYYFFFVFLTMLVYATTWRSRFSFSIVLLPFLYILGQNTQFYALFVVWFLGVFARKIKSPIRHSSIAWLILALSFGNSRFGFGSNYTRDILVGVGCMLVLASLKYDSRFTSVGAKFSKWAADFSYSVYLCHFPVLALTMAYLNCNYNAQYRTLTEQYCLFIVVIAISIIVSYAISYVTEAKTSDFRLLLRRWISD